MYCIIELYGPTLNCLCGFSDNVFSFELFENFLVTVALLLSDVWWTVCNVAGADGERLHVGAADDASFATFNLMMVQQYLREEAVHQQHKVLSSINISLACISIH